VVGTLLVKNWLWEIPRDDNGGYAKWFVKHFVDLFGVFKCYLRCQALLGVVEIPAHLIERPAGAAIGVGLRYAHFARDSLGDFLAASLEQRRYYRQSFNATYHTKCLPSGLGSTCTMHGNRDISGRRDRDFSEHFIIAAGICADDRGVIDSRCNLRGHGLPL
jgi:hypothetical protein